MTRADEGLDNGELVALRELLASPGWTHLVAFATRNFSGRALFHQLRGLGAGASPEGDRYAVAKALASHEAIQALMGYPEARIAQIERQAGIEAQRPAVPPRA